MELRKLLPLGTLSFYNSTFSYFSRLTLFLKWLYSQSLGGGASQVSHLILRAQIQDKSSPWNELEGVNVRSVAFCGPMTICLQDEENASPETAKFIEELEANSCNMIFSNDVVPRGYGYLSFIDDFVDDCCDQIVKEGKQKIPLVAKPFIDLREITDNLVNGAKGSEAVQDLIGVFSHYKHLGNQIYYKSEDAMPRVLKDMGAFFENTEGLEDVLRDVKYEPVGDPLADKFMYWHMEIIRGPGLSYPESELE